MKHYVYIHIHAQGFELCDLRGLLTTLLNASRKQNAEIFVNTPPSRRVFPSPTT